MAEASRIAVVTGAGSGIGRITAQALHLAGYSVVLAGRRADALAETAAGSKGSGELLAVPTDVTDAASVAQLFVRAVDRFGRVDLLFNNAGVTAPSVPLDELPVETLRNVIDVNLYGSMLCAREAMRVMKSQRPQGGRIINNGSISAHAPRRHSTPYATTKTAITGLTKSIGLDGREFGIACCQIDIGNAVTDLSAKMQSGVMQADGRIAPEPRMAAEHVARAVVHMASLPLDANIPFMTIMATNMPLYGRG
jgi:NAD(P)-dependent dehydrogenase (short-subunit alcohol dehydrogenase family)